jgi:DNA-binding transcriptional ArsR family regulator
MAETADDDLIWRALGDATRRRILDLLRRKPRTTGDLAAEFSVTRFAVMKHLSVLVDAGLVLVEWRGRERVNHVNPVPIQQICRRWIRPFEEHGSDQLLRLKRQLEHDTRKAIKGAST